MTSVLSRRRGQHEDADNREDGDSRDDDKGGGKKRRSGSRASLAKNKHIIEEFIDVGVPHRVAYDQWTQYDEWSKIFKKESAKVGGKSGDDKRGSNRRPANDDDGGADNPNQVTVSAKIGPSKRDWQTEVVAQRPGRRIEWEAKGGVQARGVVTFHRLDDRLTHLQVVIQYTPSGFMETIGNFLRMQRRRVRKDLKLFKNFVELRGEATGEGPGRVRGDGLSKGLDEEVEQASGSENDEGSDQDRGNDDRQTGHSRSRRSRDGER